MNVLDYPTSMVMNLMNCIKITNIIQKVKTIPARKLWFAILDAQMETGTPYLLYKDSVNRKSNQKM